MRRPRHVGSFVCGPTRSLVPWIQRCSVRHSPISRRRLMPRTTDEAVKQIIDTALNTLPFIMAADMLVTSYLVPAGLSEPLLAEIERWWAAHLITIREPRPHEATMGNTTTTFVE